MAYFKEIDFDRFLDYLEVAKEQRTRVRMREWDRVEAFSRTHAIDQATVMQFIARHPGTKITIIEKGFGEGLYVYTWNTDNADENFCYQYDPY